MGRFGGVLQLQQKPNRAYDNIVEHARIRRFLLASVDQLKAGFDSLIRNLPQHEHYPFQSGSLLVLAVKKSMGRLLKGRRLARAIFVALFWLTNDG